MQDLVELAVDDARGRDPSYAEARFQSDVRESIMMKNGVPEASVFEENRGLSVRVIVDRSLGFASTNFLSRRSVRDTVERAFKMARAASKTIQNGVEMSQSELGRDKVEVKPRIKFANVDLESQIRLLKEADGEAVSAAAKNKTTIPGRILTMDTWTTEKILITSDGAYISSFTPRAALYFLLTAYSPQKGSVQRSLNLGEVGGWEVVEKWNLPKLFSDEGTMLSKVLLKAVKPPDGQMDLVLGPEVVGIISHESCGHPGEADRVLGREAAQAGETYLKAESLGMQVGTEHVNVVDDPTLNGSFGFYTYDEEGVKARRRVLIKEGIINEFLQNRETAAVFGVESNGASRSVAFNREPIVRMANTFVEPGDYAQEELFEGVKHGVYVKNFMEWNIDDRRFNQRYVGLEAYRIENGDLKEMVRNPIIELTTVGLWSAIDAVGKDLEFQAAYCGKGDPMQGIPVWTGGPHIRLRNINLRGA